MVIGSSVLIAILLKEPEAEYFTKLLRKSKKEILMFVKLSAEKGSSDDCHAIEKAKSKRAKEIELA